MDKFINKECNSNVGINLVLNRDISFNNNNKSIKYKIILENFKNLLTFRQIKFTILKIMKS